MKPVEIYKVHRYEIVLVSPSWTQINYSATHKIYKVSEFIYIFIYVFHCGYIVSLQKMRTNKTCKSM